MATQIEIEKRKKQNKVILLVFLGVSLLCAIIYKTFSPTLKNFIMFGLISVVINIGIYFYAAFKSNNQSGDESNDNPLIIVVGGLTLAIPYSVFYIIISVVLSGFGFPFKY